MVLEESHSPFQFIFAYAHSYHTLFFLFSLFLFPMKQHSNLQCSGQYDFSQEFYQTLFLRLFSSNEDALHYALWAFHGLTKFSIHLSSLPLQVSAALQTSSLNSHAQFLMQYLNSKLL